MIDTTTSVMATGIVVTVGRWSQEKKLEFRIFVGFGFLAIFMAVMQSGNEKLAQQFAALVLVAAVMYYGVPIGQKLGALGPPPPKNTFNQMGK